MSRRVPTRVTIAVACASILSTSLLVACGDSSSSAPASDRELEITQTSVDLVAERVDDTTVLVGSAGGLTVSVPDSALPSGVAPDSITARVDSLRIAEVGTALEFVLGPDGTVFEKPVTLSWTGDWDPNGIVTLTAISDDGENLLSSDETDEVLKTLQVERNDDGSSTVSIDVTHFSRWTFMNIRSDSYLFSEDFNDFLILTTEFRRDRLEVELSISRSLKNQMSVDRPELCLSIVDFVAEGLTVSDPALSSTGRLRQCTSSELSLSFRVEPRCTTTDVGTLQGTAEAQFGLGGLSPFEFLLVLAGGQRVFLTADELRQGIWVSASSALIFIRRGFTGIVDCSTTSATTVTSTATSTATSTVTSTAAPNAGGTTATTTSRSATTTTLAPTSTTVPTTTTVPATTTTKPRGATTTLPRRPGATTTLP